MKHRFEEIGYVWGDRHYCVQAGFVLVQSIAQPIAVLGGSRVIYPLDLAGALRSRIPVSGLLGGFK